MSSSPPSATDALRLQGESLAARLPALLVEAERVAATIVAGTHGRRRAGIGETFWQFRRYRDEDPATVIDWRQSARSQHYYVREREWEAAQSVWLWRDGSAAMDFASSPSVPSKRNRASLLAIALASLLSRAGEKIALLGEARPPSSGRAAFRRLALRLAEAGGVAPNPVLHPVKRHARCVMLGDFYAPMDETHDLIAGIAASGVHGLLVHIVDPAEEDFPFEGRIRFDDIASRESILLGRAESSRAAYRQRFAAHADALSSLTRRLGWTYLRHRTDRTPETALLAMYQAISAGVRRSDGARFADLHEQAG